MVNDVDSDALSTTVDALNTDAVDEVVGIEADVSDPEAAARLVEDAASFVTGTTVTVDGGLSLG
ncbi:MAG: hypothetical protein BRD23_04760 [Halobacteriales archaeon SW_9_67_25]|nr:MAG: hypothetical protein BRD23_04760 [Halobacteriales archaeon SW_9_67_25]